VGRCIYRWLAALSIPALAAAAPEWRLTRNQHFEIYAQTSDQRARALLGRFEQLRIFFQQQGWKTGTAPPVRVIAFASDEEYRPYRLRATADAYYVGSGDQDYIVIGADNPRDFRIAAHEYAHLVLRASELELPLWLKEGLAELYSTLRMDDRDTHLGGPLPGRLDTLRRREWMPLGALTGLRDAEFQRQDRVANDLFYAESWALTSMLALSPKYAARFPEILAAEGRGVHGDEIFRDLHAWVDQRAPVSVRLPPVPPESVAAQVSAVSPSASRVLLAQLLLAAGEFDRAQALLSGLDSADVSAALGMIALHKGDTAGARRAWKRAIEQGIADAKLCYRYAILADQAGLGADDIRPALERAVALQPDFDDARYQLALLEKNSGRYEAALHEFQAMRKVPEPRAFAYWLALADTFNELGRRGEAESAARHASQHAANSAQRARAAEETYIAQTDLGVQFARDASGHLQLVTTRTPHPTADWNPFIEPGDDIRKVDGTLREIDCGGTTTIRVEASGHTITLAIPDLQHVQMRHAPAEFTCGVQNPPAPVAIEYAADGGIVRGMDFR
jgi:hypothetical protein